MFYKIKVFPLPEVVAAYEISRQTVWRCADEQNIIVIILDGTCCFTIANNTHKLSKGDIILIPAGQEYIRRPFDATSCRFAYVHFKTHSPIELISNDSYISSLEELQKNYYEKQLDISELFLPQITSVTNKFDKLAESLNKMMEEYRQSNKIEYFSASLTFLQLLLLMQKNVLPRRPLSDNLFGSSHSQTIQASITYVRKNYENKISLEDLKNYTNVSAQHLIRLFRKELNMTPVEYINHVKILHAIELLRSSNLTVEEIAYKLGFDSSSYFGRVFKKHNGNTPVEERRRIKNFNKQQ